MVLGFLTSGSWLQALPSAAFERCSAGKANLAAGPAHRQRRLGPGLRLYPENVDLSAKRQGRNRRDFPQITPAKPKQPPITRIQSGLSRVEAASTAAAMVAKAAAQVWSAARATISALAAINPIDSGTSDVWMMAGHRDCSDRASQRLTK